MTLKDVLIEKRIEPKTMDLVLQEVTFFLDHWLKSYEKNTVPYMVIEEIMENIE